MEQTTIQSSAQQLGNRIIHKERPLGLRAYRLIKRTLEVMISLLAIVALSPPFLVIAIMIFVDDPKGSPFFVQKRCGRHGETFNLYKFRSMYMDAETKLAGLRSLNEMSGPVFKIRNDPRITRIGRFIRKTSIDELPQIFNVLKGDMSIVGPRPPLPDEVQQYNEIQLKRLSIKPGLTCYWQVTHRRNSLSFDEWVALDLKYITEQNLLVDLKLMLRTMKVMFMGEGV